MSANLRILKWSLFAGALYFFLISVVHLLGIKAPILYIYFNVPSNAYQDRIISFLAFGWAVFLFTAFTDPQKQVALVNATLVAGAGALVGLAINNGVTGFQDYGMDINPAVFWLETAGVFVYWLWLVVFTRRAVKPGV
jgi:hypothetical protein